MRIGGPSSIIGHKNSATNGLGKRPTTADRRQPTNDQRRIFIIGNLAPSVKPAPTAHSAKITASSTT
jgi:hypothetical protein